MTKETISRSRGRPDRDLDLSLSPLPRDTHAPTCTLPAISRLYPAIYVRPASAWVYPASSGRHHITTATLIMPAYIGRSGERRKRASERLSDGEKVRLRKSRERASGSSFVFSRWHRGLVYIGVYNCEEDKVWPSFFFPFCASVAGRVCFGRLMGAVNFIARLFGLGTPRLVGGTYLHRDFEKLVW